MGIPAAGFSPPPLTVVMPTDAARRELIDRLALFVAAEGHTFECAIMEREQLNPVYRFLFDQGDWSQAAGQREQSETLRKKHERSNRSKTFLEAPETR